VCCIFCSISCHSITVTIYNTTSITYLYTIKCMCTGHPPVFSVTTKMYISIWLALRQYDVLSMSWLYKLHNEYMCYVCSCSVLWFGEIRIIVLFLLKCFCKINMHLAFLTKGLLNFYMYSKLQQKLWNAVLYIHIIHFEIWYVQFLVTAHFAFDVSSPDM